MNRQNGWLLLAVLCAAAALVSFRQGFAAGKETIAPARVGVVNVTTILETCKKNQQWQEKSEADRARMQEEFQQMRKDLEALQGVRNFPVRVKCALLAWVTFIQGIKNWEEGTITNKTTSTENTE